MINEFLLDILTAPGSENKLEYHQHENTLEDKKTGKSFPIISGVPVILPSSEPDEKNQSAFHKEQHSAFRYAAHYEQDAEYYDYFLEEASVALRNETKRYRQAVLQKVPAGTKKILDAGCGSGWVAAYFVPKGTEVVSMDISLKNPLRALEEVPGPCHAALVADVYHLPVKNDSFDVIIASAVMEHLFDPKLFISRTLEALRPGGKLILLTPYDEKIQYHICVHCNKPTPENAHLYSFNEKNLPAYLPSSGISVQTSRFTNKYFAKLRLYNLTGFLSYRAWRLLDKAVNKIFFKPSYFLIVIEKL